VKSRDDVTMVVSGHCVCLSSLVSESVLTAWVTTTICTCMGICMQLFVGYTVLQTTDMLFVREYVNNER
jgi:hypothetical protein